jgi:hypothetical protein
MDGVMMNGEQFYEFPIKAQPEIAGMMFHVHSTSTPRRRRLSQSQRRNLLEKDGVPSVDELPVCHIYLYDAPFDKNAAIIDVDYVTGQMVFLLDGVRLQNPGIPPSLTLGPLNGVFTIMDDNPNQKSPILFSFKEFATEADLVPLIIGTNDAAVLHLGPALRPFGLDFKMLDGAGYSCKPGHFVQATLVDVLAFVAAMKAGQ